MLTLHLCHCILFDNLYTTIPFYVKRRIPLKRHHFWWYINIDAIDSHLQTNEHAVPTNLMLYIHFYVFRLCICFDGFGLIDASDSADVSNMDYTQTLLSVSFDMLNPNQWKICLAGRCILTLGSGYDIVLYTNKYVCLHSSMCESLSYFAVTNGEKRVISLQYAATVLCINETCRWNAHNDKIIESDIPLYVAEKVFVVRWLH